MEEITRFRVDIARFFFAETENKLLPKFCDAVRALIPI